MFRIEKQEIYVGNNQARVDQCLPHNKTKIQVVNGSLQEMAQRKEEK